MNTDERKQQGRRNILSILRDCDGYLLPENTLLDQLLIAVVPPPTNSEAAEWISFLDRNGFIAGIRPELGGPIKWKITDKGKLAL